MRRTTQSLNFGRSSALVMIGIAASFSTVQAAEELRFNRDIRPILAETCFHCHGPGERKGGLRLDQREHAVKTTDDGAGAIVPGKAHESEMIRRILSSDETEVMPPPSARKPLSAEQKDVLQRWITQGAPYEKHWAFEPQVKEPAPKAELTGYRIYNPIDAFVANRLKREGLTQSVEADKETLIRRVAFALTGLPPSSQEVDLFVGDTSSRGYENMVERYLYSPRFGEEMARHWLDVARYADTHGLHLDNERQMWLYRDWVVKAFNDGMPFDQFTIEQLAGDLLPNASREQKIATGFNRCNVSTSEGGSIEAEWYFRNAVDRTTTMAETWMGVTAGCAVCHDHKYDPLSHEDFYSLYAFFYSAAGPALDGNNLLHEPYLKLTTPEQETRLADYDRRLTEAKQDLDAKYRALDVTDPADTPMLSQVQRGAAFSGPSSDLRNPLADDPHHSYRAWLAKSGSAKPDEYPYEIEVLLTQAREKRGPAEGDRKLREYFYENICIATKNLFLPLIGQIDELAKERWSFDGAIPGTFVFAEADKPRDAFVMVRGQYDKPGKRVAPNTPAMLPPLKRADATARATRLDLARWLASPEHPLTARVTVNRFWQQMIGTGLVKTSFDFGSQGTPPTHPELLDWLAVTFRESGWDMRAVIRLIVTSATFRQVSSVTPELHQRDPENQLLARGPRFRLDAEQVRDNALFVSGLINLQMGGKGVKPYQPPNIWEPLAFSGSNTGAYRQDSGPALYRRSLYTFLKRTAPPPYLANFDAPSREAFCTRRDRSDTPLQALQLMNDVQHFEAARALAQRMMTEGGASPRERINFAFRVVLARRAEDGELAVLEDQWNKHRAKYVRDGESAKQVSRVGESAPRGDLAADELAAYALTANTLLNLDETINRN